MGDSFQNEVPTARVNIKLDLHTGGVQKKVELPLKLLTVGDFSNGREQRPLSEREKIDINKNNFNDVLAKFSPVVNLSVKNTLADDDRKDDINLTFKNIRDFEPEQVARNIPQLRVLLAMRNLLRDLKSKEGANKQVISSQADSLIKISRIWADFFPANTSNQPI
ncbi:type VI secretion system contractile sheath small subunit [Citrobacter portucalensis]